MTNLFDAIGGQEAVNLAVDRFYEKVLNDDRVKHFFANTNMERQRAHQKAFLTYAFGGTSQYTGRNMRDSHKELVEKMGLNDSHFDAIAENLVLTLQELGVNQEIIDQVVAIAGAESHRNDVLNR